MIRHEVKIGDSLWRLAHRYLGSGTRWRLIYDFHNREYARFGQHSPLIPIKDENLIYVGQTLLIPPRTKNMPEGNGTKAEADKISVPIDLKVEYTIGKDTPPLVYTLPAPDFTLTTEMTGKFSIELLSPDRYNHNLELAFGKDPVQIKSKLKEIYDPAVCALTAKPEMAFDSGKVKIKAPIAAKHDAGIYEIEVQADTPTHMSGSLKIKPFSSKVMAGGRECGFEADIELKAEVDWHPMARGKENSPYRAPKPVQKVAQPAKDPSQQGWQKVVQNSEDILVAITITIIGILTAGYGGTIFTQGQTTTIMPFTHSIDPTNPKYLRFQKDLNA